MGPGELTIILTEAADVIFCIRERCSRGELIIIAVNIEQSRMITRLETV